MASSAPTPPTPPNPLTTASAQSTANAATATAQTALNNANQITPWGTLTYAQTGSQTITNPDGTTTSVPTYTSTQTLSPVEQRLFNEQNQLANQSNNAAAQGLKAVNSAFANPVTEASLPALTTSLGTTPSLSQGYKQGGAIQTSVPVQQAGTSFGQTANGVQYMGPQDFSAETNAATNAALARLQPSMDASNAALQSQLANQGVTAGSKAFNDAMLQQAGANNDLRLGAVQTGDQEQQALFGEAAQQNQLFNAAQQQDFNQQQGRGLFGMQAMAQNNAANLSAGDFHNTAQGQQNAENAAAAAFRNQAIQGDFGMKQAAATFGNQAREQSLGDQETINNNAINQISALMHGGQVSAGQYQGYTPGQIGTTPISADTYASANEAEQQYQTQAQMAAQNNSAMFSTLGGLFGMGARLAGGGMGMGMSPF